MRTDAPRKRHFIVVVAGERRRVTIVSEGNGRWRHPSGLLLFTYGRGRRWHLGTCIPHNPLREREAYMAHPRWAWWKAVRHTLGDYGGFGIPLETLVERLERALAQVPLPPVDEQRQAA